jgi:hypothetical protein
MEPTCESETTTTNPSKIISNSKAICEVVVGHGEELNTLPHSINCGDECIIRDFKLSHRIPK